MILHLFSFRFCEERPHYKIPFITLLNDEYNTSKKCCNCGCEVENLYMPITNKETGKIENKKIHRLMRCKNCIKITQQKLDDKLKSVKKGRVRKSKSNITSSESRKIAKNLRVIFNGGYFAELVLKTVVSLLRSGYTQKPDQKSIEEIRNLKYQKQV